MKKKDVPQDKGLMDGRFEDLCYAVDENGKYVPVLSAGWEPKNDAMRLAWEEINDKVEEARQQVLTGKRSSLYFYMIKNIMDVKLLADYIGLPRRKVRRHMKPEHFSKLDHRTLTQYAELFNITVESLINFSEDQEKNEKK